MTDTPSTPSTGTGTDRITSLDAVRGWAVLGILTMNIVSFGLGTSAYFNLDDSSPQSTADWVVGVAGEIFFDQKFMAMFSMLFGAGIALFSDRAAARSGRPALLSLWRNSLLLAFGLLHGLLWDGDVLQVYALCAPVLIVVRGWSPRTLASTGLVVMAMSPLGALLAQASVGAGGEGLGEYWGASGELSDPVGLWLLADFFARSLGMMLLGIAAYRIGFLSGSLPRSVFRTSAIRGLVMGLPLSALGVAWLAAGDFGPERAVVASIPNTIATVPVAVAYISLVILWHGRASGGALDRRIRCVGRMALTNYLAQTAVGLFLLDVVLDGVEVGRLGLLGVAAVIWALQLWWSPWWLRRHRFGPAEWLWRAATYGRRPGS